MAALSVALTKYAALAAQLADVLVEIKVRSRCALS